LWNGSSKIQFFTNIWHPFWRRPVRVHEVKKVSNSGSGINFHYSGIHWASVLVDLLKHLVKPGLYFVSTPNGWPCRLVIWSGANGGNETILNCLCPYSFWRSLVVAVFCIRSSALEMQKNLNILRKVSSSKNKIHFLCIFYYTHLCSSQFNADSGYPSASWIFSIRQRRPGIFQVVSSNDFSHIFLLKFCKEDSGY
jgi:hypothetical protein